jgi:hypothetical protein
MVDHQRVNQVSGAIFLIGMGIIAIFNYWWPGIMFIIGAALIARAYMTDQKMGNFTPGIIAILIGLLFALQNVIGNISNAWPLILIGAGLLLLFGRDLFNRDKPKNG